MNKRKFTELLMQANHQFIMQVNHINFFLNLKKEHIINDIGIVAINQHTGKATIVFLDTINEIIIDSKTFFIKS